MSLFGFHSTRGAMCLYTRFWGPSEWVIKNNYKKQQQHTQVYNLFLHACRTHQVLIRSWTVQKCVCKPEKRISSSTTRRWEFQNLFFRLSKWRKTTYTYFPTRLLFINNPQIAFSHPALAWLFNDYFRGTLHTRREVKKFYLNILNVNSLKEKNWSTRGDGAC